MELTGYARFALPVQARACHELVRAAGAVPTSSPAIAAARSEVPSSVRFARVEPGYRVGLGAGRAIETLPCHGCSTTAEERLHALFALQSGADYDGRGPLIPIVLTQHFVIWRRAPYPAA
jgi:hypothetical protein